MMQGEYNSKSDKDTKELGKEFAGELSPGDVVLLYGDLGFGKTTFVQGVALGLGIKARIISPTFTIIRTHGNMHHIDLYRIEDTTQLESIGISDLLQDSTSIKLIEWPEKLTSLPKSRWDIKFEIGSDNTRTIHILKHE